jgi:phage terminase large subunit-like protein
LKNLAEQYISDVMDGKILTGKYARLAVERHLNDFNNPDLYFDKKAGEKIIEFFPIIPHFKGKEFAGKPFELNGWQAFINYSLFGWKKKKNDVRRFTLSYTEVAKKNGKSMMCSGTGIYMTRFDGEPGAEVYSAATTRDQACEVFNMAKAAIQKSPDLQRFLKVQQNSIFDLETMSKFEPLSSDYDSFEGKNPYCAIIDEFHAHKDSLLFNNIESATVARSQSLIWIITTAGFNMAGPCFHFRKMCTDVLEGRLTDDGLFAIIFCLDEGDDWHDSNLWIKANPNLDVSVFKDKLEGQYQKAINSTDAEMGFKTKNLNMWIGSGSIWISDDKWQKCNPGQEEESYPNLEHSVCYASLDLASTTDITVFGLLFKVGNMFHWKPYFFLPEMTMEERVRRDHVNYDKWINEGYMISTGGNSVDHDFLRAHINEVAKKYKIKNIQFDRWNSSQIVTQLMSDGANMVPFGQGYQSMSTPCKEIEKLVLSQKINFGNNPVMRWMNGNVMLRHDPAGNIKIDKDKSIEKVDGMVALAMAIGGYLTDLGNGSVYDKRGILEI